MSSLLYQWGKLAHAKPWYVIGAWVLIAGVIIGFLGVNPPRLSNDIRIDGTPSQEVIDELADRLPEASGGQGIIAFHATDGGRIDEGDHLDALLDAIDEISTTEHVIDAREVMAEEIAKGPDSPLLQAAGAIAQVDAANTTDAGPRALMVDQQPVPGVAISADGETALFQFVFDAQTFELHEGTVANTVELAATAVDGQAIEVLPSATMIQVPELIGVGEIVGVAIAALVLILTLGSLLAAGLPLVSALGGIVVGVGGAFALSTVVPMHSLTAVLALMLGLAVGIDYALFIANRQRRFILDQRVPAVEATGRALGTAGSAVLFAGGTVVIALLGLLVVNIQLLTTMALVAASTVILAVLSALTLLPALLGVIGERICSARARLQAGTAHDAGSSHRVANAWSGFLIRHRLIAAAGAAAVAVVIALPAMDMTLGLPSGASYNTGTPQRQSFEVVSDGFGAGYNGPLVLMATSDDGDPIPPADLAGLHQELTGIDGVAAVSLGGVDEDGVTAVFSVIPETAPTSMATAELVGELRERAHDFSSRWGVDTGITGFAALAIDVSDRLADVLPLYIAVVVGLSLIVLLLVFRSIIVPIKATAGFLLSVVATFGATTAVFEWGWLQPLLGMDATAPVLSLLPIIVTGVLYGLAMDYEVFLVSSMKEAHVHGRHGVDAVNRGFAVASRVVVAAAIIMTSVFAGFVFNPEPMIAQVGFALAIGVLIDAFLVRMTFVPAIMSIVGDKAWWLPRWLDRILPDLDIEGDKLNQHLVAETARSSVSTS
ncbi:MMPL family transporter [Agromyces bauzanensis]|uniref:Membrane protein n=1 Tax=Agromyces bauzanensis TaxID=1308924 RepID=A0A917UWD1_9MICO|nr:MMPL family transporter [Agromyces bauzanensis]GGJ89584.1 membrane protein [Agromyces bauzanensis]